MRPSSLPVCELREWEQSPPLPYGPPQASDLALTEGFTATGTSPLPVTWLHDGTVRVAARSWVGVVRFSSFEVRVIPKLVGGNLGVLAMVDYASGLNFLRRLPVQRTLPMDDTHLLDLLCLLLAEEATSVARQGLLADYRMIEEPLGVVRGRLLVREQVTRRFGQLAVLECRFDEFGTDVPENQLVALALSRAARVCSDERVRRALRRVLSVFEQACEPEVRDPQWYRNHIVYGRRNGHYREVHELSHLILEGLGLRDLYNAGGTRCFSFLLDMNVLFERFVTRLLTDSIGNIATVAPQMKVRSVIRNELTRGTYAEIRPDIVVEHRSSGGELQRLPIDAKYKLYDMRKVSPADIYQVFLYAYAFQHPSHDATAAIFYPAERWTGSPRLGIRSLSSSGTARLSGWGIDVQQTLRAISEGGSALAEVHARMRTAALEALPIT